MKVYDFELSEVSSWLFYRPEFQTFLESRRKKRSWTFTTFDKFSTRANLSLRATCRLHLFAGKFAKNQNRLGGRDKTINFFFLAFRDPCFSTPFTFNFLSLNFAIFFQSLRIFLFFFFLRDFLQIRFFNNRPQKAAVRLYLLRLFCRYASLKVSVDFL